MNSNYSTNLWIRTVLFAAATMGGLHLSNSRATAEDARWGRNLCNLAGGVYTDLGNGRERCCLPDWGCSECSASGCAFQCTTRRCCQANDVSDEATCWVFSTAGDEDDADAGNPLYDSVVHLDAEILELSEYDAPMHLGDHGQLEEMVILDADTAEGVVADSFMLQVELLAQAESQDPESMTQRQIEFDNRQSCLLSRGVYTDLGGGAFSCCWADWGCWDCSASSCTGQCTTQACCEGNELGSVDQCQVDTVDTGHVPEGMLDVADIESIVDERLTDDALAEPLPTTLIDIQLQVALLQEAAENGTVEAEPDAPLTRTPVVQPPNRRIDRRGARR